MTTNFTITNSVEVTGSEYGIHGNSHYVTVDFNGKSYNVIFKTDYYDYRKIKSALKDGATLDDAITGSFVGNGHIFTETDDTSRMTYEVYMELADELTSFHQKLNWSDRDALFYQFS